MRFIHRRGAMPLVAAAIAGLTLACGDTVAPTETATRGADELMLRSSIGIAVSQSKMHEDLAGLARSVAVALADSDTRVRVYAALGASPFREQKLRLRTLLLNDTVGLLTAVATATGRPESAVMATLDSLVDLEIYLPVDEHRTAWNGGAELLVASYPDDDGTIPRGFDLAGQEVRLSPTEPPDVPTLVLTGVETNFDEQPAPGAVGPSGRDFAAMEHYADSAIFMKYARIPDDHEGWGMGDPEFEVHTFLEHTDAIFYDDICSGEKRPLPYTWDMNSSTWSGDVMVATEAFIGETHVQHQMWEDDSAACGESGGRPPKTDGATVDDLYNWASAIVDVYLAQTAESVDPVKWVKAAYNAIGATYDLVNALNKDDFVGIMEGPVNACWPAEGVARFEIRGTSGGTSKGHAELLYTYGKRDPVCPLSVQIDGPTVVYSCAEGESTVEPTYDAIVFSGTGTTSYDWREDGVQRGTGPTYTLQDLSVGTRRLDLIVTRGDEQDGDHLYVDVQDGGEKGGCEA